MKLFSHRYQDWPPGGALKYFSCLFSLLVRFINKYIKNKNVKCLVFLFSHFSVLLVHIWSILRTKKYIFAFLLQFSV